MPIRSIKPEYPIDPITIEILRAVAEEAAAEGIEFMLVGATARDILLKHVFGIETRRATYDVDFAVAVKDWQQFNALRDRLVSRATFKATGRATQRLYYKGEHGNLDVQLDLVPFGEISEGTNEIKWPPDMKTIMNVAGYDEVLGAAEQVEFSPGLIGKVVSLAGLAILKIIAWSDRGRENPKDIHDLFQLMESYTNAGNFDRIYQEDGIIEVANYDPDLAGVYLLGRDIARLASAETLELLKQIIARDLDRIGLEMIKSKKTLDDIQDHVEARLASFQSALS